MTRINPKFFDDDFGSFTDPHQRRHRQGPASARSRRSGHAALDEILQYAGVDRVGDESAFRPTFTSSRHEREWILNYLGPFYDEGHITDVLRQVEGGKEATVYCCAAHPSSGFRWIAAKVYRPRMFRQLRNDARYRAGRDLLDAEGKAVKKDWRLLHAVAKGTDVGKAMAHTSWMEHEYRALETLHAAGADVPRPLTRGDSAILMEYLGDAEVPAPALSEVRLDPAEARTLFERLLHNVKLMLACDCVHGDLSAYNVLYWDGDARIIDFPQVVDPRVNRDAFDILRRDVTRLCQHFARYRIESDPDDIARAMWARHVPAPDLLPVEAEDETPSP